MQKTISKTVSMSGIGLHSGHVVNLRIMPAPVHHGIVFERTDLSERNLIDARFFNVSDTKMNTRISNGHAEVSTIEHLMAALAGLGVTNAHIQIDAPEVPVLDGSSLEFVKAMFSAGITPQNAPATSFKVIAPVSVEGDNGAYAELLPDDCYTIDLTIDFDDRAIGRQQLAFNVENGVFLRELANCRTFCRAYEVEALQNIGLALGGSLENAVVVDGDVVLNPEGFRREDECVRHKMLDALGDLYLAGGAMIGRYNGYMSGHGLTNQLLRKAFAQNAIVRIASDSEIDTKLPGYDICAEDIIAA